MPTGMSNSSASCQNGSNRESWGEIPSYCGESSPNALIRPDSSSLRSHETSGKSVIVLKQGRPVMGACPPSQGKTRAGTYPPVYVPAHFGRSSARPVYTNKLFRYSQRDLLSKYAFQILTVRRKQATKIESIMRKL